MSFDPVKDETEVEKFYILLVEEVLSSNPDALELLKNLSVINMELDTNIDRKSINASDRSPNVEESFKILLEMGIIRKKI